MRLAAMVNVISVFVAGAFMQESATAADNADARESGAASQLEEVVVTAQRREERLMDTPQSVSALTSDDLARLAATRFADFANTVPGLSFATEGSGQTQISLRGVTTGYDPSSTVVVYIDDVPYGSSTSKATGAQVALDPALFDVNRVEVLRGPQGVLYGASAMGGLVNYVTKTPDLNAFGVVAQTGVSSTHSGGTNYNAASTINVPLSEGTAALRASVFGYRDGGFIDNVATDTKNADAGDTYGGRLDLLLVPASLDGRLSVRVTGFAQNTHNDGSATADYTFSGAKPYGALGQDRPYPGGEPLTDKFQLATVQINYDFGFAKLTSISGYQDADTDLVFDASNTSYTSLCGYVLQTCNASAALGAVGLHKFTQELRFASQGENTIDWLLGGFYDDESSKFHSWVRGIATDGQPLALNALFDDLTPSTFREIAGFAHATWHVSKKFDLSVGARVAQDKQTFEQIVAGALLYNPAFGIDATIPPTSSTETVATYLANARYHLNDHAMVYLRYATGYRPGGPNYVLTDPSTGLPNGPAASKADHLKNYEVGVKAESSDRRYSVDLDAYAIDWSDIQVLTQVGGFPIIQNVNGKGTIYGSELTLSAVPLDGLSTSATLAYTHAYLNQADPILGATQGERLPGSARFAGALNGDYSLPVATNLQPTIGATLRYVGDRTVLFRANPNYYELPEYTTIDLRAGVTLRSTTSSPVNVQLYVHNLTDEYGQLGILHPEFGARVGVIQPRTVGLSVSTRF
jgi:iron complex outermembrane recepter protein